MAKGDVIGAFMRQYGRIYEERLNPKDQQFVMDELTREMEDLRARPSVRAARPEPAAEAAANQDYQTWQDIHASSKDDPYKESRDAILTGLGLDPEGLTRAEGGQIIIDEFVKQSYQRQTQRAQGIEDREPLETSLAKKPEEASREFTESEKQEALQEFGQVIDAADQREATWVQRFEEGLQASVFNGRGQTDALQIRSGGQYAESWAASVRPEKGASDLERAVKEMGLEPQIRRQAEAEKGVEKGQQPGGEGMEP